MCILEDAKFIPDLTQTLTSPYDHHYVRNAILVFLGDSTFVCTVHFWWENLLCFVGHLVLPSALISAQGKCCFWNLWCRTRTGRCRNQQQLDFASSQRKYRMLLDNGKRAQQKLRGGQWEATSLCSVTQSSCNKSLSSSSAGPKVCQYSTIILIKNKKDTKLISKWNLRLERSFTARPLLPLPAHLRCLKELYHAHSDKIKHCEN